MKPGFALSLSPDGISLLHRAAGGWRLVGDVALDTADLVAALADLREKAKQLSSGPIFSKLIVPNDQIRYLTLETGLVDNGVRMDLARAALDGATPYPVDELAFDLSEDGVLTHVAAVAIETLEEAESFAVNHGFGPTSFVAAPGEEAFLGEPFFGTARAIRGTDVDPDGIAVINIGPANVPKTPSQPEPSLPADDQPDEPSQSSSKQVEEPNQADQITLTDPLPVPSFSSRRHKPTNGAPVLQGASRETAAADKSSSTQQVPLLQPGDADHRLPDAAPLLAHASVSDAQVLPGLEIERSATSQTSVSGPSVPSTDQVPPPETPVTPPENTAFASRRQTGPSKAAPAKAARGTSQSSGAGKTAASGKVKNDPFAMREPQNIGGKPRFLGPVLIAALILFMAAIAAWAVYSNPTWISFGKENTTDDPAGTPVPIEDTVPVQPLDVNPVLPAPSAVTNPDPLTEIIEPQVSALPENLTDRPVTPTEEASQPPALTGTDIAVLDALQESPRTDLDVEAISDGVENTAAISPSDLSQAAQYAAVGIWQNAPEVPELPAIIGLQNLYVASIDNTDLSQDAVALPSLGSLTTDTELNSVISPAAAGSAFDLDERGLVRATPEGTLNPDGVMVFLGRPNLVPPPTPDRPDLAAEAQVSEQQAVLARLRPRARPDDLVERAERAQLGGLSLAELGQKRPRARPATARPENENSLPTTDQAIATSTVPRSRPANFANLVDRARRNSNNNTPASAAASVAGILNQPASIAPATVTPSIPTSASVARQATMENSINLRKVNLIGVYGTPSNRRALVRLSSGRYKKVKVGDKIDGGQVVAIGDAELRYQRGGRNVTLKMPNG
ncbi:hypothetical protein EBB79_07135 [Parasedimentitalea marina]|uniref:Uncharacterized protein n=1 Tax=Parasedimentitalea marina TaxID=2483033 RepID=A0A3T0N0Z6_9RHOB|nr:hypothetical protein [Parasedimentitalea marina]AZV77686.1 hypothetical protein EBB79_07135 [Parasedimentitalea marina]